MRLTFLRNKHLQRRLQQQKPQIHQQIHFLSSFSSSRRNNDSSSSNSSSNIISPLAYSQWNQRSTPINSNSSLLFRSYSNKNDHDDNNNKKLDTNNALDVLDTDNDVASQLDIYTNHSKKSGDPNARALDKEPPYQVSMEEDQMIPMEDLRVHQLSDNIRLSMYKKHLSDPSKWTYQALAENYGTSLVRAKAVLYLMARRDEMQKELLGEEYGIVHSNTDSSSSSSSGGVVSMSLEEWVNFYNLYMQKLEEIKLAQESSSSEGEGSSSEDSTAATTTTGDDTATANEEANTNTNTSTDATPKDEMSLIKSMLADLKSNNRVENSMSARSLQERLTKIAEHIQRESESTGYQQRLDEALDMLASEGVNIAFKEADYDTSSEEVADKYFPELFHDEEEKDMMEKIKARLERFTAARRNSDTPRVAVDLTAEFSGSSGGNLSDIPQEDTDTTTAGTGASAAKIDVKTKVRPPTQASLVDTYLPSTEADIERKAAHAAVGDNMGATRPSKFKWAFKDLAQGKDAVTMIRTRQGELRQANGWELSQRSWSRRPRLLDVEYHKKELHRLGFFDADKDNHVMQQYTKKKKDKRKKLIHKLSGAEAAEAEAAAEK